MKAGPYLATELQDTVARSYVRSYERLADWAQAMRIRGVTDRLAATMLLLSKEQHSHLVRLPGHSVLADLLGITRESIVRAGAGPTAAPAVSGAPRPHALPGDGARDRAADAGRALRRRGKAGN